MLSPALLFAALLFALSFVPCTNLLLFLPFLEDLFRPFHLTPGSLLGKLHSLGSLFHGWVARRQALVLLTCFLGKKEAFDHQYPNLFEVYFLLAASLSWHIYHVPTNCG